MPEFGIEASHLLDGRYLRLEELGHGAFGSVYRADQRVLGHSLRQVAVKLFDRGAITSVEEVMAEAAKVISAVEGCTDPRVRDRFVTCLDAGLESGLAGRPYLVMELVRTTLETQLGSRSRPSQLPSARVHEYVRQLCEAMAFLHSKDIVHRDLKPANILISQYGSIKIGDFGLATQVDALLKHAPAAGTLLYQPWEAITLQDWTKAADVYAIGLVGFEMLTGALPSQDQLLALAGAHSGTPPHLDQLAEVKRIPVRRPSAAASPAWEGSLGDVVMRAISVHRLDRYEDAGQMLRALDSPASVSQAAPHQRLEVLLDQIEEASERNSALAEHLDERARAEVAAILSGQLAGIAYQRLVRAALRRGDTTGARRWATDGINRRPGRDTYLAAAEAYAGTNLGRSYADRAQRQ